ncbi:hypothetical protein PSPO01_14795 [Paraphaeosphaeria sporulosa]
MNPKLLTTASGGTRAYLHGPYNCGAHARSRWSFNHIIAISLSMQSLFPPSYALAMTAFC